MHMLLYSCLLLLVALRRVFIGKYSVQIQLHNREHAIIFKNELILVINSTCGSLITTSMVIINHPFFVTEKKLLYIMNWNISCLQVLKLLMKGPIVCKLCIRIWTET